jgi:hypothetical protein
MQIGANIHYTCDGLGYQIISPDFSAGDYPLKAAKIDDTGSLCS